MSSAVATADPVRHLHALTGLRFVAAMAVLLVHARLLATGLESNVDPVAATAVSFFFVLSGFILTYVYDGRLTWRGIPGFVVTRLARIWPLHLVCLAAAVGVMIHQGRFGIASVDHWQRLATHALLVQSWVLKAGWSDWFNGPAWSISTELGFYLLFPLILLMRRSWFWCFLAFLVAATLGSLWWLDGHVKAETINRALANQVVLVNPLFRLLEFVAGMAAARLGSIKPARERSALRPLFDTLLEFLVIGLLIGNVWMFTGTGQAFVWLYKSGFETMAIWASRGGGSVLACGLTVWLFARSSGWVARFLSRPLMVWLGEVSFALYLIQQPVLHAIKPFATGRELPVSIVVGTIVTISLGLAAVLHVAIEGPLRQSIVAFWNGRRSDAGRFLTSIPKQLWDSGVALGALIVVACAIGVFSMELGRSRSEQKRVASAWGSLAAGRAFESVTFQGEAILHGVDIRLVGEDVRLTLLWEVLPGNKRNRFIHFTDDSEAILKQGVEERELFANASPHGLVLDEIVLKPGSYPADSIVGVGFFGRDGGTTRVDRGVLGMINRRLEIARLTARGPVRLKNSRLEGK